MHDLHEANKIIKVILDYANQHKLKKVVKTKIELGSIIEHGSEINPENLAFNIQMLARRTLAQDLKIEIKSAKIDSWVLKEIEGE